MVHEAIVVQNRGAEWVGGGRPAPAAHDPARTSASAALADHDIDRPPSRRSQTVVPQHRSR